MVHWIKCREGRYKAFWENKTLPVLLQRVKDSFFFFFFTEKRGLGKIDFGKQMDRSVRVNHGLRVQDYVGASFELTTCKQKKPRSIYFRSNSSELANALCRLAS